VNSAERHRGRDRGNRISTPKRVRGKRRLYKEGILRKRSRLKGRGMGTRGEKRGNSSWGLVLLWQGKVCKD